MKEKFAAGLFLRKVGNDLISRKGYFMKQVIYLALMVWLGFQIAAFSATKPGMQTISDRPLTQSGEVVPGVVIVKFKHGVVMQEGKAVDRFSPAGKILSKFSVTSVVKMFKGVKQPSDLDYASGKVDLSNIYVIGFDRSFDPRKVAQQLSVSADIEYAEPQYVNRLFDVPNDPFFATNQTNAFTRMNAMNGWTIAKGDSNVVIADVDGGTYWQHEDIKGNLWINPLEDINHNGRFDPGPPPAGDEDGIDEDGNGFTDDVIGWNFANNSNNPQGLPADSISGEHGTQTASIFGAVTNNATGMAGSSWNCRIMPICAASSSQDGFLDYPYQAITYAYQNGAKVINCSFGREGAFSQVEQDVINAATQAGALIVAAAGNGTNDNSIQKNNDIVPTFPASYPNVLAVGSTFSTSDIKPGFSNYGTKVPVYAPGSNVWTAFQTAINGYGNGGSGTSFSTPFVSGLAGIVTSLHTGWSPLQVAAQIRVTSDSIDAMNSIALRGNLGHGRVNYYRAFTESHPGIDILSSSIVTTKGKSLFLAGDTIVASLTVRNVLFTDANNLTFSATTSDTVSVAVLQGTANVPLLAQGSQTVLPDLKFVVSGSLGSSKNVALKITWISNTNDRDSYAFSIIVYPTSPLWLLQTSPTHTSLTTVKSVNQNIVWAGGGNGSSTAPVVVKTTDGGMNWSIATGNLANINVLCISATDENHCWVGTDSGKIFATTNGGTSWSQQLYPGTQTPFMDGIAFIDMNNGYAIGDPANGSQFIVLKTTNGGQSWSHTSLEPTGASGEFGYNNSDCWTDINHGWFGTNMNKIWRTTDGGVSWSSSPTGGHADTYGVSFKDNSNGVAAHSDGAVSVSTNGGATWATTASISAYPLIGATFISGTNYAWVSDYVGPFRSTDNGTSWGAQSLYPFSGSIQDLSLPDTLHGWAVTSDGEILAYNPLVTSVKGGPPGENIPRQYSLSQNYPNPFNPTTSIVYALPTSSKVVLKIFDIVGREVFTLVNTDQPAGTYTVSFDGTNLASGIYLYRLFASGSVSGSKQQFTETRKLVLVK